MDYNQAVNQVHRAPTGPSNPNNEARQAYYAAQKQRIAESVKQTEANNALQNEYADLVSAAGRIGNLIESGRSKMKRDLGHITDIEIELARHRVIEQYCKRFGQPEVLQPMNSADIEAQRRRESLPGEIERLWRQCARWHSDIAQLNAALVGADRAVSQFRAKHGF